MLKLRHIPVLLLSVLLGACINEEYAGPDPNLPTRTIVVWLGGDNNLSDETVRKIEALRQGWTYTGNKCLIKGCGIGDIKGIPSASIPFRVNTV